MVALEIRVAGRIQQSDLIQIVIVQNIAGNANLFGHKPNSSDAAALSIAPILHLNGGFVNKSPCQRYGAGKTRDAAPTFFGCF